MGIPATELKKIGEGSPNVVDWIENGDVDLVVNTPTGSGARSDGWQIRRAADRARDPVPDHALRRPGRGARDRGRAPGRRRRCSRCRRSTPGACRPRPASDAAEPRTLAPFGRRTLPSPSAASSAPTSCSPPRTPTARAAGRAVLHARRGAAVGRGRRRAPVPAAGVQRPAGRSDDRLRVHARGRRARHRAPVRARARRRPARDRPARPRLPRPARRPPRPALRGRGGHRAAGHLAGRAARARRSRRRRCWASATPTTPRARRCCTTRASPPTTARTATTASSPTCWPTSSTPARRPSSTPAARRRCSRRCARCARRAASRASSRWRPGMACGFGACFGCVVALRDGGYLRLCVDGPVLDGARLAEVAGALTRGSTSAACAWRTRSSTARAPSTPSPRAAPSATRCSSSFPFAAFVSKTITLAPRDGNPPPRLYETPAGLINSIGLPNKGLRGYLEHDLPELARLPVPLVTNVMGSTAAELCALVEALDARDEVDALELNVSCPNVSTGLDIGADPGELAAVLAEVRPRTAKPLIVKLTPNTADVAAVAQAAQEAGADAVSLINTLRAYAPHPRSGRRRRGWATRPAGCRDRPSARSPSRRSARSPRASRSRSSAWAACRAAYTPRTCSMRARRSSPSAPRASAIRPREHGSHASLTICSQRAGTTSADRRDAQLSTSPKSLQTRPKPSSSLDRPRPQVEVEANSRFSACLRPPAV